MSAEPTPIIEHLHDWQRGHGLRIVSEVELAEIERDEFDEIEAAAARSQQEQRDRRWHRAVPQRFHHAQLADFDSTLPWFGPAELWARHDSRRNVVLLGPVGAGKTHLATALCRPACDDELEVRLLSITKLLDMLRPDGPPGTFDALCEIDRLIIDDVGTEKVTDWTQERFGLLVDQRWSEERPTVFTTNLAPAGLEQHVGARCYSRMVGGALVIEVVDRDRRRAR